MENRANMAKEVTFQSIEQQKDLGVQWDKAVKHLAECMAVIWKANRACVRALRSLIRLVHNNETSKKVELSHQCKGSMTT